MADHIVMQHNLGVWLRNKYFHWPENRIFIKVKFMKKSSNAMKIQSDRAIENSKARNESVNLCFQGFPLNLMMSTQFIPKLERNI